MAQIVVVLRDVGVQQQQGNSADLCHPDPCAQRARLRHRQFDHHRGARGIAEQPQRETLRIQRRVVLVLPAVRGQRLPEVAGAVVQADADQRQAQIGGGLEVVAGQDAQTAGVDRQHLGDAELHREVADAGGQRLIVGLLQLLVPERLGQVVVEFGGQRVKPGQEFRILGQFVETLRGDRAQHSDRIAATARPLAGVDALEQVLGGGVPRPPQIRRQPGQRAEALGEMGTNGEPAEGLHRSDLTEVHRTSRPHFSPHRVGLTTTV